jgi:hypothetical protein
MNIVFAYHSGDCELALESAKAIVEQGVNIRHKATVCCTDGTPLLPQITEELKKVFPEVGRIIAQDGFDGWPLGPNQMFADASSHCYQYEDPWYFWEPDCVPMVEGWVDKLEEEFNKNTGKIMGCFIEGGVAPSGKIMYQLIVGSAVYPSKFLNGCRIAANLYNYNIYFKDKSAAPEPWDVRCRWEFLQYGRDTPLIRAYWKSCNYQRRGESIVFFAEDAEAQDVQNVTCPDRTVSPKAVVVHGCKDGSLHRMIYDKYSPPVYVEIEQPEEIVVQPLQSKVTFVASENKTESEKFLANLRSLGKTLGKPKKSRKKKKPQCKQNK